MRILLCIISVAFGALSMAAALSRIKAKERELSHIIMSVGSLFLIGAVIFNILNLGIDWIAALIGVAMICIAAFWNGKRNGNFHIQHHIIRIALSFVLVIGFIFL